MLFLQGYALRAENIPLLRLHIRTIILNIQLSFLCQKRTPGGKKCEKATLLNIFNRVINIRYVILCQQNIHN